MRKVEVIPHQPQWKEMYEKEAERLRSVFGDLLVTIYHIGSTAVPGLAAKPVIDIMPVVKEIEAVDTLAMQMESLGYIARGEYGIPGRRFFHKGEMARTHHVHVFAEGNPEIIRHLAFRDYLRLHPIDAHRYGELKITGNGTPLGHRMLHRGQSSAYPRIGAKGALFAPWQKIRQKQCFLFQL